MFTWRWPAALAASSAPRSPGTFAMSRPTSRPGRSTTTPANRPKPPEHRVRRLAVSRWIENTTDWSIKGFVTTAHRYRTIQIEAGQHPITAADPTPDDLQAALDAIHATHQMTQLRYLHLSTDTRSEVRHPPRPLLHPRLPAPKGSPFFREPRQNQSRYRRSGPYNRLRQ